MTSAIQPDKDIQTNISIRPVVIPDDILLLQQWLGVAGESLIPLYESIEASSFMKAMMVWDNDTPLFQVDICESLFDDLGTGEWIAPGDYTLRIQLAPDALLTSISQGLHNCMAYVFHEKKARRILVPVYGSGHLLADGLAEAGFTPAITVDHKRQQTIYVLNSPA